MEWLLSRAVGVVVMSRLDELSKLVGVRTALAVSWAVLCLVGHAAVARADSFEPEPVSRPRAQRLLEEAPVYGQYYDRYEPTIYTGFAPRALDPKRLHLHVGRGNQLRATLVLSNEVIATYARDLLARRDTLRALIDDGRVVATQNRAFEAFETTLRDAGVDAQASAAAELAPHALRARNLALMERLNPGRVFAISLPESALVQQWLARVRPEDAAGMSTERQLELVNALLPTRLWVAELSPDVSQGLRALVASAAGHAGGAGSPAPPPRALASAYFALLEQVSGGFYPRADGRLVFAEFTAIYPIGTFNEYTDYRGHQIPLYPTPGRRALTTHQRTRTVDHIPTKAIYSYSPWIPYMHVGTTLHNSFHTLWWRMDPEKTAFLPASWQEDDPRRDGDGPSRYLWLLSRGPMSHGCTHVTTGHLAELRQLLPSDTEKLYAVDAFLNRSYDYDVFDIDGDLQPEVMGVHYFIAYSLRNNKPHRLRVRNTRADYYRWLYGDDLQLDGEDGVFRDVQDGHFVGRRAVQGEQYAELPLYEAAYEPEQVQFYRLVDIDFARELRKVSFHHPLNGTSPANAVARE